MNPKVTLGPASPFFIVSDLAIALEHYVERLGFACRFKAPEDNAFFAIVGRDAAQIMLKVVGEGVQPQPNSSRHPDARWDVFVHVADPDALAREFTARNVSFHNPLADTHDGLRGFEIADPDGYVCFFGRPVMADA